MGPNDSGGDNSEFWRKWHHYAGTDILMLLLLALVGVVFPDTLLDSLDAWKQDIPGQKVNLEFEDETTNMTYESEVWLQDPSYSRTFKKEETVTSNELFVLCAVMPPLYIILFLFLLTKIPTNVSFKKFQLNWVWFELITFGYAFIIAMGINYWVNKSLKILVSMPIPDFYDRCELDSSDLNNLHCVNV